MGQTIPIKPAFGAPCNGCGVCCTHEACDLSVTYLNSTTAPCIALERSGEGFVCGLLTNPMKYVAPHFANEPDAVAYGQRELSPKFAYLLRVGAGCDAS